MPDMIENVTKWTEFSPDAQPDGMTCPGIAHSNWEQSGAR